MYTARCVPRSPTPNPRTRTSNARGRRLLAAGLLASCVGLLGCLPAAAHGAQRASLNVGFSPDRLGASTTVEFGFHVESVAAGQAPSPLTEIDLKLPAGVSLATSSLGLAVCQPTTLLERGPDGCRANARIGAGAARGEVTVGGEVVGEAATVDALLGPPVGENEQILFYVMGAEPLSAELIFPGALLLTASVGFSGSLNTSIPLVRAWSSGPYIALTSFSSTLGPLGLTYYRHRHGKVLPFTPRGIAVPGRCPRGGFPFAAEFAFLDGSRAGAVAAVPCPGARARG
jgi:hypothetical protein